jgi:hypothetical protein
VGSHFIAMNYTRTQVMRPFLYFFVKTENMRTQIWCAFFFICLSKLKICVHRHEAPFSLFVCQNWKYVHTNMMRLFLYLLVKTENMRTQIWCAFFSIFLSKLKICAHKYDAPFSPLSRQNLNLNLNFFVFSLDRFYIKHYFLSVIKQSRLAYIVVYIIAYIIVYIVVRTLV